MAVDDIMQLKLFLLQSTSRHIKIKNLKLILECRTLILLKMFFMMKWTQGFFILIWRFGKPLDSIKMTNDADYFFSDATCIIE